MSPSLGPVTRSHRTGPPDLHATQGAGGSGAVPPAAPAAPKAPPPPNVLNAQAHPLEHQNDSPSAAMLRGRQGMVAPAGPGAAPGSWDKLLAAGATAGPAPAIPAGPTDDAKLAAVPREQMKREVEDARAALVRAKTPGEQAAAHATLGATKARAEAWSRAVIKQAALKYAGAGASKVPERYLELLAGPNDTKPVRASMLKMSTCALFARGVWRQAGVDDARLENKYKEQQAVADVVGIARSRDAWVGASNGAKGALPKKGDVILIDDSPHKINPKTGKPQGREHVIVVVGDPRPDPANPKKFLVDTVEGGQGQGGHDSRAFGVPEPGSARAYPPRTIERRDDGTLWMGGRKVVGWADAAKVADPAAGHTSPPEPKASARKPASKAS